MRILLLAPALVLASCGQPSGGAENTVNEAATNESAAAGNAAAVDVAAGRAAQDVAKAYFERVAKKDFKGARELWADGGAASGGTAADLARSYNAYKSYVGTAGEPTETRVRDGKEYIIVQAKADVKVAKTGKERTLTGMVYLRRAADESSGPEARSWRIWAIDLRSKR